MGFNLDHSGRVGDAPSMDDTNSRPSGTSQCPPPRSDLIQIIEGEIIPRLFLAHRERAPHRLAGTLSEAGELADPVFLAELFLCGDVTGILGRLQSLLGGGVRRERIYLDLLAPVPRTLSQFWTDGRCNFDEMAVGLCCVDDVLQKLHELEHAAGDSN